MNFECVARKYVNEKAIVLQAASLYGTPSVLCRCNWVYCILAAAFNQLKLSKFNICRLHFLLNKRQGRWGVLIAAFSWRIRNEIVRLELLGTIPSWISNQALSNGRGVGSIMRVFVEIES